MKFVTRVVLLFVLLCLVLVLPVLAAPAQGEIPSWDDFWGWIRAPMGLGIVVVAIVALLKRLDRETMPPWVRSIGVFVAKNAALSSFTVALVLSGVLFAISAFGLEGHIEQYFGIFALAWVGSQGTYGAQKALGLYAGRVVGREPD